MAGGNGNDILDGGNGADTLYGEQGNKTAIYLYIERGIEQRARAKSTSPSHIRVFTDINLVALSDD